MKFTRILIADSLPIFRSGVRNILSQERDFDVAECGSLDDLRLELAIRPVDVALIDLELPPRGGLPAVEEVAERSEAAAIVWSFQPRSDAVLAAIRAGAQGYIEKGVSAPELVRSIRAVLEGEAALSGAMTMRLIEGVRGLEEFHQVRQQIAVLSTREQQVLGLVAQGARNKEIATALTISEFTVKRHVQNILRKLGVPSRGAASAFYRSLAKASGGIGAVYGPRAVAGSRAGDGYASRRFARSDQSRRADADVRLLSLRRSDR
jgi:DNA-binding NarL/FixJ family response regulator